MQLKAHWWCLAGLLLPFGQSFAHQAVVLLYLTLNTGTYLILRVCSFQGIQDQCCSTAVSQIPESLQCAVSSEGGPTGELGVHVCTIIFLLVVGRCVLCLDVAQLLMVWWLCYMCPQVAVINVPIIY